MTNTIFTKDISRILESTHKAYKAGPRSSGTPFLVKNNLNHHNNDQYNIIPRGMIILLR